MQATIRKAYDETIDEHYRKVAEECGLSATSTMADEITRRLETEAIIEFVGSALGARPSLLGHRPAVVADVGCGNGYTLERLVEAFPGESFVGIEKSTELRELALSRFRDRRNVAIVDGDIRNPAFFAAGAADVLICQRVLINLLDAKDQAVALENVIALLAEPTAERPGGRCVFIEAFSRYLGRLNDARAEFELPPIPPAHHNLYLNDDFFRVPQLRALTGSDLRPPNFLSTHYYVTRVLHPVLSGSRTVKRNSEFVRFMSAALKENVGDYSPLRLHGFERIPPPTR